MHIINPNTFEKVTAATLARDFPNRSFSLPLSREAMEELGYALFVPTEKPRGDVVAEGPPVLSGDGRWYQTWDVRDYTPEEADQLLAQKKVAKKAEINAAYEQELHVVLRDYPEPEVKSWDKQEAEARAWAADNSASTPYLDQLATARDLSKSELVARVIAKADAWIALSASATGKRQRLEDEIEAAQTFEALEQITWGN